MRRVFVLVVFLLISAATAFAQTREAAFVEPGKGGSNDKNHRDEVVYAEPSSFDVGETIIGVSKRVTLFLNNSGVRPVVIGDMQITSDGNVRAELLDNDCQKLGTLPPGERCSVAVQITPNSPGPWAAEMLAVHDAQGRVTRAAILGTTAGEVGNAGQQPGLSLLGASKDQQIDFGDVEVGVGHAVRTILLINDSTSPLVVSSIDLVAADRGLNLISEGGCQKDTELAPGSSCPVTVMWEPSSRGDVSTDLIIRHTGPVGFAVIPVRGKASGGSAVAGGGGSSYVSSASTGSAKNAEKAEAAAASLPLKTNDVPSISSAALFAQAAGNSAGSSNNKLSLRGTVGQRAILADTSGTVTVAGVGQTIVADNVTHKIMAVEANRVIVEVDGTKVELTMGSGVSSNGSSHNGSDKEKSNPLTGSQVAPASTGSGAVKAPVGKNSDASDSIPTVNSQQLMAAMGGK